MYHYPAEFHSKPEADPETLANLGPLTPMAGIWTSDAGLDVNPKRDGLGHQIFSERYELQPIEAQTNGLQLFYGLRYHTRVVTAGNPETLHDQVGYWLWEPAAGTILLTLSLPRGQTAMAVGQATADEVIYARSCAWFAHERHCVQPISRRGIPQGALHDKSRHARRWYVVV